MWKGSEGAASNEPEEEEKEAEEDSEKEESQCMTVGHKEEMLLVCLLLEFDQETRPDLQV